jgi:hypothetical protein
VRYGAQPDDQKVERCAIKWCQRSSSDDRVH